MSGPDHRIVSGDLFASGAQTLVNAVNCRGVMGAGIAKAFRQRYPSMFRDYQQRCAGNAVRMGEPYLWISAAKDVHILNFPTKDHWRDSSDLNGIVAGLAYVQEHYKEWGITSLAVPALGCGLGGLSWERIQPLLIDGLRPLDIPVRLYRPQ